MLKRLIVSNFKTWEKANLEFGEVTGLFGTNSSGKTSLIQFLLLLKQTKDAADRGLTLELGGPHVALGSYRDFIRGHDETLPLPWSLAWQQENEILLSDPSLKRRTIFARGRLLRIRSVIEAVKGTPTARFLEYQLRDHKFRLKPRSPESTAFDLQSEGGFAFRRTAGRAWQLPGPIKAYGFPDQALTYFQNTGLLSQFVAAFEGQMDRTFYLGPLREHPKREYVWARSRPSDVGQRGERAIDAILAATDRNEMRNVSPRAKLRPFQEMIAYWLREMGLVHSFAVREIKSGSGLYQAMVKVRPESPEVLLTEVGFGVSQVLPVLTLLYYVQEGSTVILEQPEIHLHPSAQASLADVILAAARKRKVQVIVESHSEHLLLRLQRRVAEGNVTPDEVKLYFCKPHESTSTLVPLELDLFGRIGNWPKNFFGDSFGEASATQLARLKRKEKSA